MRDNVVIICINGLFGVSPPSGMMNLRNTLRNELQPLGVNIDNIFRRSWNHNQNDNPFAVPWVSDLNREIERRTNNPSYLALIGHSYGGWAACRLSRITRRKPDFVALIDPVFGPNNVFTPSDRPRGLFIKNWYQANGIQILDYCTGARVPCFPQQAGISCGYKPVPGAHENVEEKHLKNWAGNRERKPCPLVGRVPMLTAHVTMDDDVWIWRQIRDRLFNDISKLIPRLGRYAIKTWTNKYVSANNAPPWQLHQLPNQGPGEAFILEQIRGNQYAIKTWTNKYVSANNAPPWQIHQVPNLGPGEIFSLEHLEGNNYAIKTWTGKYVSANNAPPWQLHQLPNLGPGEIFTFERLG